jgi:demethylmenaquinone methyltransferase / 2-methoxy-6-polyprenyl-1,4-benzoquinol methylase
MTIWKNPGWYDAEQRRRLLDEYVDRTGKSRYGMVEIPTERKKEAVKDHFNRVAKKYDFMNTLLSLGLHHAWKRKAVRMLDLKPGQKVLDVCGGTGDISVLSMGWVGPKGRVVLYDINRAMVETGKNKRGKRLSQDPIFCIQGDGEAISFQNETFDAVIVGFGIRNFTRLVRGFKEMHRVLKPGGKMICLEFSRPKNQMFRALYDFYSFNIMPFIGKIFTGSSRAYACLPETIRMFPMADELTKILEGIGFIEVSHRCMTNGVAVAHIGKKQR